MSGRMLFGIVREAPHEATGLELDERCSVATYISDDLERGIVVDAVFDCITEGFQGSFGLQHDDS